MANTVIALRKSAVPSAEPTSLANGELALNYADGKIFYKAANGTIVSFAQGGPSYGTVNANGTLVVAGVSGDVLTLVPGDNISITADAINDTITISAAGGGNAFTKYSINVGNGTANTINVVHALDKTDIWITVRENSTGFIVYPDIKYANTNMITLQFVSAPTSNQYYVSVLGG